MLRHVGQGLLDDPVRRGLDTPDDVARFWTATGADPDTHNAWLDGMRIAREIALQLRA